MRKIMKNCLVPALLTLSTFSLPYYSSTALADATFDEIFGELATDGQVDTLVDKEKKEDGYIPLSSLANDLLLSQASLQNIERAIQNLRQVIKSGGWPTLTSKGRRLKLGDQNKQVETVKILLMKQGDLKSSRVNLVTRFDYALEDAIISFQKRHGLRKSGYVDRRTRLAMAISAQARLGQLILNKQRLQKAIRQRKRDKYVVVNVPDYSLQAVNGGRIELSSRVVVGRPDRQTPDLFAHIEGVNFNPFWHVPSSLIKADIIPNQIKDPKFMKENHLRVFTEWGGKELQPSQVNWRSAKARTYRIRQEPGDHNALGRIRIQMPNPDIVYLHDTPTQKLYGLRARAYSAGCVRVEKIRELSAWILKEKKDWSRSKINKVVDAKKFKTTLLRKKIPVQFVYITSWVDSKGNLNFREDIYNRDRGLKRYASRLKKVKGAGALSP